MPKRLRLLFIHPGPVPPDPNPKKNTLYHLSDDFEGDLLSTWWEPSATKARHDHPILDRALGSFRYHATRSTQMPSLVRATWNFVYFVTQGLILSRRRGGYDAVIAYGPFTTALAAYALKLLLNAKLVVDVPGHLWRGFAYHPGLINKLKQAIAKRLAPFVIRRADAVKLLYPQQLDGVRLPTRTVLRVFHDLVPLATLPRGDSKPTEQYILFLGFPWQLKGVDILISGFLAIADRFPNCVLKVVGHCDDRTPFEHLAAGHPQVELHRAVPHAEAMELMAGCSIFVLPSRTEAMGKVLLEAMAMGRPVVASRVDGIPHYVQHEQTGLLFETENSSDLATQLARYLDNPAYAQIIGENARRFTSTNLSELAYVRHFQDLIQATVGLSRSGLVEALPETPRYA